MHSTNPRKNRIDSLHEEREASEGSSVMALSPSFPSRPSVRSCVWSRGLDWHPPAWFSGWRLASCSVVSTSARLRACQGAGQQSVSPRPQARDPRSQTQDPRAERPALRRSRGPTRPARPRASPARRNRRGAAGTFGIRDIAQRNSARIGAVSGFAGQRSKHDELRCDLPAAQCVGNALTDSLEHG